MIVLVSIPVPKLCHTLIGLGWSGPTLGPGRGQPHPNHRNLDRRKSGSPKEIQMHRHPWQAAMDRSMEKNPKRCSLKDEDFLKTKSKSWCRQARILMKKISKIRQIMARDEGNRFLESSFWIGGPWGYRTSDLLDVVCRRGISQPRLDTVIQYIWNYKTRNWCFQGLRLRVKISCHERKQVRLLCKTI